MKKNLFIFTNSFPFGNGYQWLKNELETIHSSFEEVHIFPYSYEGKKIALQVPKNTIVHKPSLQDDISKEANNAAALFSKNSGFYFQEFLREKVFTNRYWFKSWLAASKSTEALLNSDLFQFLISREGKEDTSLYFYWGNNQALLVPFLRKLGYKNIVVRFHGFDLYKERLGGYQPFRRALLQNLSLAAPVSDKGKNYLKSNYPDINFASRTCRLGTVSRGLSLSSSDGKLRIFSCARLIKLKRITLIADALKQITNYPIVWTHLGDGEEFDLLREKAGNMPANVQVDLIGWVKSDEVLNYYVGKKADLFINVSTTEGVPVSIMEAFSAGIPAMATDVGGTGEIVNEANGILLKPQLRNTELAAEILNFYMLPEEAKLKMRKIAFSTYNEVANTEKLSKSFLKVL